MKKIQKTNYRVEIYPRTSVYGITVAEEEDVCKAIVSDVKRHVNDVQTALIVCDNDPVCEHCGSRWTEDDDNYNGGCCKKDEEAEIARTSNPTGQPPARLGAGSVGPGCSQS